jgi:hypothetical protein
MLFLNGHWAAEYGGVAWAKIAREANGLEVAIANKDINKILYSIDRLNDLEHNNDLYLRQYSTFNFNDTSQDREFYEPVDIFNRCSESVRELRKFWQYCVKP